MEKAFQLQKELAAKVITQDDFDPIEWVAGADVSNNPFDPENMIFGAMVVLNTAMEVVETAVHAQKQDFPYIPGLLGFREIPVLIEAFKKLKKKPDLILVDGHGVSHPRGLGVASHLGVVLDVPTIGVAKSILVGEAEPLGNEPGSQAPLNWKGKEIARMVRTKKRALPLIISAGHRISLQTALKWVFDCLKGYRLPECTRQAHLAANACRKEFIHAKANPTHCLLDR